MRKLHSICHLWSKAPFPYTRDPACGIQHAICGYFNFTIKKEEVFLYMRVRYADPVLILYVEPIRLLVL